MLILQAKTCFIAKNHYNNGVLFFYIPFKRMKNLNGSELDLNQVIKHLSKHPDFPNDYCNVASKALLDVLLSKGKNARLQFSFSSPGDAHTFVVETLLDGQEIILDPTYAQYDSSYRHGFVGYHFPDLILENNRMEGEAFMQKQKEWWEEGVYRNL